MFNGNNGYSLSDFAALMGNNRNNGFDDAGGWWIIILFLFFMNGGWGDWGNNGHRNAATTGFIAAQDALTRSDLCSEFSFQNLDRSIGACDDSNNTIYISKILGRSFMKQVIGHEITHAVLSSYDIELSETKEELVSELISRFGKEINYLTEMIIRGVN